MIPEESALWGEPGSNSSDDVDSMRAGRPLLIIVNGRPCTGKSHLASVLADKLRIPLFSKDTIKDLLGVVVGAADRTASKRLGIAAIALMYQQAEVVLKSGLPAMIESPLLPEVAAVEIETLQIQTDCRLFQIFLRAEPSVILERFRSRARRGLHFHEESLRELEVAVQTELEPVPIRGRTLVLDTTNFDKVNYAEITEQIRRGYHRDG